MDRIKTAVFGCGIISEIYFTNMMQTYNSLDVVACTDLNAEAAQKRAAQFGIEARTAEDILADPEIQLICVFTPAPAHYTLIKQALLAGKHVYTEKPLTPDLAEGKELLALAEDRQLMLGSAPETFMGSCFQTGRKAIDDGVIGAVTGFSVSANRDTDLTGALYPFIRKPGGDICSDYGIYYLTALISLLGPVSEVFAYTANHRLERVNSFPGHPEQGQTYIYDNESQVNAVLKLKSGVTGCFALNGDSNFQDAGLFHIYGEKGILQLGDANQFGAPAAIIPNDYSVFTNWRTIQPQVLEPVSDLTAFNCRGIGPSEMGAAIASGKTSIVDARISLHVLDVIRCIRLSGRMHTTVQTETTCEIPAPFRNVQALMKKRTSK